MISHKLRFIILLLFQMKEEVEKLLSAADRLEELLNTLVNDIRQFTINTNRYAIQIEKDKNKSNAKLYVGI